MNILGLISQLIIIETLKLTEMNIYISNLYRMFVVPKKEKKKKSKNNNITSKTPTTNQTNKTTTCKIATHNQAQYNKNNTKPKPRSTKPPPAIQKKKAAQDLNPP